MEQSATLIFVKYAYEPFLKFASWGLPFDSAPLEVGLKTIHFIRENEAAPEPKEEHLTYKPDYIHSVQFNWINKY